MGRMTLNLIWLVSVGCFAACSMVPESLPADPGPRSHVVHVISNGWHTAIVIARADVVTTGLLPEAEDFPDVRFLEFSWGDRVYFPARETTLRMTLSAAFWATPAIMHVAGRASTPASTYADIEVLGVTQSGLRRMVRAIASEFVRSDQSRAKPVSRGIYWNSYFYKADGTFHLFNTCNTWVARMVRKGGVNLSPSGVITADDLMRRLRAAINADHLSVGSRSDKLTP